MKSLYTRYLLLLVLLNPLFLLAQDNAPVVTNVNLQQRTDGTMLVDIHYDVYDADGNLMAISIKASSDSGASWNLSCNNLTGAVGTGISSGIGKHIVWDVSVEHPNFFSNTVIVEITADDGGPICPGIPTVTYGGKIYNTVQIGSQCWLKENLDVGTMIQVGRDQSQTNNGVIEKYCYDNNPINCDTYGGLYQWDEVMQYSTTPGTQGICPSGWHIPTSEDFNILATIVSNDGNSLKAIGQGSGSGAGTNTSGFSALMAGNNYYFDSQFNGLGISTEYWGSTKGKLALNHIDSSIQLYFNAVQWDWGFSVRCLKDN